MKRSSKDAPKRKMQRSTDMELSRRHSTYVIFSYRLEWFDGSRGQYRYIFDTWSVWVNVEKDACCMLEYSVPTKGQRLLGP